MSYKRVTLGKLRTVKLPAKQKDEADHVTALRNTLDAHAGIGDAFKVAVPQVIAEMITPPDSVEPAGLIESEQTEQSEAN